MRRSSRVAAIAACVVAATLPAEAARPGATSRDAPPTDGVAVSEARGGGHRPCPPVDTSARFVEGGCRAVAYDFDLRFTIRTAFGATPFGACTTTADVSISADGRIWLDRIRIGGPSPCNDAWGCAPRRFLADSEGEGDNPPLHAWAPWTGRLRPTSGGGAEADMAICLDTCVGRYEGRARFELASEGGGWVLRARNASLTPSPLAIDGELELRGARFALG